MSKSSFIILVNRLKNIQIRDDINKKVVYINSSTYNTKVKQNIRRESQKQEISLETGSQCRFRPLQKRVTKTRDLTRNRESV